MKIIIDTNLWISFLIGKRLSLLKKLLTNSDITVYVCDELIQEFKDVSQRGKIRKYIFEQDIWDTLKIMDAYCHFVSIKTKAQSPIRDAKDLYLLSLAETVHADYILTGDKDLLVLKAHLQTRILTYSEFSSL